LLLHHRGKKAKRFILLIEFANGDATGEAAYVVIVARLGETPEKVPTIMESCIDPSNMIGSGGDNKPTCNGA
jgi:hypothetical protein